MRPERLASSVLVGREDVLALADVRLGQAARSHGQVLLVAGEAGIGKTRLLAAVVGRAALAGFVVARAAAFPGDAEVSGAVLLGLASDLRRSADAGNQVVGTALAERLRVPLTDQGDPHRQRRLLVQDLIDGVLELDPGQPLLLVLEDLHWADQLSLEVIGHVAAQLAGRQLLVVAAYRSDELFAGTPTRDWRSRLLAQRLAEEVQLPRLRVEQTALLATAVLGQPVPAQVVAAVQARSDGVPLYVEELLAAISPALAAAGPGLDSLDDVRVPDTLADAVLARVGPLAGSDASVVAAAAVIGRSFDFDLVTAVTGLDANEVDRCLRYLRSRYVVEAGADPSILDFRHALVRQALYDDLPLTQRRDLHERVAKASVERGYGHAFVSGHFDLAGLAPQAYRHALAGGFEAAALSAHREALTLFRRALRHLPLSARPAERAELLTALADEAAAVDENESAAQAYRSASDAWLAAGDPLAAAGVVPRLVAVEHLLGAGLAARAAELTRSLASIEPLPGSDAVRARLLSALAAAYMLDRRLDEAISYGEQGKAASRSTGDEELSLDIDATLGSVLVFAGRMDDGWSLLGDAVARSIEHQHEAAAARGQRMIGTSASVLVEYDLAEPTLTQGIAYAEAVELWNHRSYMSSHLAHVQWARGRWTLAQETATHALADGRGGITTRITAQYVLGYVALGRGDWDLADELLRSALAEAESMAELQRLSPPQWGLAEAALLTGDATAALAWCERGYAASAEVADAAYLFPFLLTGTRAQLALDDPAAATGWIDRVEQLLALRSIPGTLPAIPHARGLVDLAQGRTSEAWEQLSRARTSWAERDRFWEGTWATLDLARCAARLRRTAQATALMQEVRDRATSVGAETLVHAAEESLRPSPGRSTKAWEPLTDREFTVAERVAAGRTNREIAAELVLSPKTVSAHVEHILAKLGVGRRAEIAAWVTHVRGSIDQPP